MEDFTTLEGALVTLNLMLLVGAVAIFRLWRRAYDGWGDALRLVSEVQENNVETHAKWGQTLEILQRQSVRWATLMRVVNGELPPEKWLEEIDQYELEDLMRENSVAQVSGSETLP